MPSVMRRTFSACATLIFLIAPIALPQIVTAQTASSTISINAQDLIPHAALFISPPTQTVIAGSTFDVSVYLNTEQNSVNTLDLTVQFPPDKMQIVSASAGTSLIQLWLKPPTYSNTEGIIQLTGVIPNGVVTQSGLITTMTFKAIAPGDASVIISPESSVLANDGLGTEMTTDFGRADYTITPQPPQGVTVFSPTHPDQSQWYNNNNPVFEWEQDPGVTAFSYVLDNEPYTVPGDTANSTGTMAAYQNLGDGLWYFHIKAQKAGVWGATTNFLVQIDTQPPAAFTPAIEIVNGSNGGQDKALISFFTTDSLSGIDHYEVAVTDNNASSVASPIFIQAQSPYQLAISGPGSYHIIVRAFDKAGNVRDASTDFTVSTPFIEFLEQHSMIIIIILLLLIIFLFILHYFFGHKLLRRVHRAIVAIEEEDRHEKVEEAKELIQEERNNADGLFPPSPPNSSPEPPTE